MSNAETTEQKLQPGIRELHKESQEGLSELAFARDELNFFQNLLEKNVLNVEDDDKMKQVEHLQNRLIYYRDELVDQYIHEAKESLKYLAGVLQSEKEDEQSYRKTHRELGDMIMGFTEQLRDLKHEHFNFVERVT